MIPLTVYAWEITTNQDEKRRVVTEGPNVEEAISEFRKTHGDETIFKIKYLIFRKGQVK